MTDDAHAQRQDTDPIGATIQRASATVSAPSSLRAAIGRQRLRQPPNRRRPRRALTPIGVVAAVATILVVALSLAGGSSSSPSVASAAAAALRAPTQPAPRPDDRNDRYVTRSVDGVRFPNYAREAVWRGWRTVGARLDHLGGRRATTVVYGRAGTRLGYTIVAGRALAVPQGSRTIVRNGVHVVVLRRRGAVAVTWERDGHTCVMASRSGDLELLLRFATWW
jgi:hypothetical protein